MVRAYSRLLPLVLAPVLTLALSACASSGKYPSLMPRAVERITGTAQVVTPEPAPPAAPIAADFTARLAQLVSQARAANDRFARQRPGTERLIASASGAAVASEAWSVATVGLADLEAARGETIVALAELDQLYASESIAAAETGDPRKAQAAAEARKQVDGWVAEQDAVLARLDGRLRS